MARGERGGGAALVAVAVVEVERVELELPDRRLMLVLERLARLVEQGATGSLTVHLRRGQVSSTEERLLHGLDDRFGLDTGSAP